MNPTAEILTLTGNLLSERTLEFATWAVGKTQRAVRESYQVGGKGINVVKMLHRLGTPAMALCFTGGAAGSECEAWLRLQEFRHHSIRTSRPTRIGVVVRGDGQPETTFFSPDVAPDAAAIRACAGILAAQPAGQVLAVCGSIPGWSGEEFSPLRSALGRWLERGLLAVDCYGPPLAWFVEQPVALVKINAVELRSLFADDTSARSTRELLTEAVQRWPVRNWIVTDGPNEIWIAERGGTPEAVAPLKIAEVSPTGSGDVLFACVLESLFRRGNSLRGAVTHALPYAAANAAHPGVAEFPWPTQADLRAREAGIP